MSYIIDRIEDGIAVLEDKNTGEIIELPKKALPRGAKEGQLLTKQGESFVIDRAGTDKRREEMRARLDKILGKK